MGPVLAIAIPSFAVVGTTTGIMISRECRECKEAAKPDEDEVVSMTFLGEPRIGKRNYVLTGEDTVDNSTVPWWHKTTRHFRKQISKTHSTSHRIDRKLKVGGSVSASLPCDGAKLGGKLESSMEFVVSQNCLRSTTELESKDLSIEIYVPPFVKQTVSVHQVEQALEQDYILVLRSGKRVRGTWKGTLYGKTEETNSWDYNKAALVPLGCSPMCWKIGLGKVCATVCARL